MRLTFFIRRPILASVISLIILFCGTAALFNLRVAQFPKISPPAIHINAAYPGANAETGSKVVAAQIENQMKGIDGLLYMASTTSSTGGIIINLTFEVGTDLNLTINEVLNRIQAAMPLLPNISQKMGVTARKSAPDTLMMISFYSDPYLDPLYVSNYLQRTVQNDLLLIPEVGTVSVFGTGSYGMRIWLDPNKMARYALSVDDLEKAVNDQNHEYVIGKSNAVPDARLDLQSLNIIGQQMYTSPEQLANIVVRNKANQTIRVKDFARVELGSSNYTSAAQINFRDTSGKFRHYPSSTMQIALTPSANQIEAKQHILAKLSEDSKRFPSGLHYRITLDNSRFVAASLDNVSDTIQITFLLVGLVIMLFLKSWRASLIAICTVPVSIIGTLACLYVFGYSLNTLSMFALILAIGIVVDDAIVIVENILRLQNKFPQKSLRFIVELTMQEVVGALIAIVLVLSVVFIPVMTLSGLSATMYREFAVTISSAVVLSGLSALTFTPAICCLILKKSPPHLLNKGWFGHYFTKITQGYLRIASYLIDHSRLAIFIWLAIIAVTLALFKLIPLGFVPNEDQGLIMATMNLPSSANLQKTQQQANKIIEKLTHNPNIASVISISGVDFLDSGNPKSSAASFSIVLKDWKERLGNDSSADSIIAKINALSDKQSGVFMRAYNQPPMRGLSTTGGTEFYLENRLDGDPVQLQAVGDAFIHSLTKHKEVKSAFQTLDSHVLALTIIPDLDKSKYYGISLNDLYNAIQAMYSNANINYAYIMQGLVWVVAEADYRFRASIENLRNVYIKSLNGSMLPVNSVVSVKQGTTAAVIQRFNNYLATKIVVNAQRGYSSGEIIKVIEEEAGNLPLGYDYDWFGTSYQQKQAQKTSGLALLFSILMIYLVLAALYERWSLPLVVLMGIPFAMFGSALILLLSGKTNDLYFQISLLALLGLSAKNIILLLEFALGQLNAGYSPRESALNALQIRLRPIVMTSLTFVCGTLPLVFARGAGANAQNSVGIGIIGGILGSVFLATLFTPVFFMLIVRRNNHKPTNH